MVMMAAMLVFVFLLIMVMVAAMLVFVFLLIMVMVVLMIVFIFLLIHGDDGGTARVRLRPLHGDGGAHDRHALPLPAPSAPASPDPLPPQ